MSSWAGLEVLLKAESLQTTGSFKVRGALNAVLNMRGARVRGIVAHSAGNHAQAVAFAAGVQGLPCHVVLPESAPSNKVAATKALGASVELVRPTLASREQACQRVVEEKDYRLVPPYNDVNVIAGQGTMGLELMEQVEAEAGNEPVDAVLVPVSGGGMLAGVAFAVHHYCTSRGRPPVRVIAVEPQGKDLALSLAAGRPLWDADSPPLKTIADGCRSVPIGSVPWPLVLAHVDRTVLTVTDEEIIDAQRTVMDAGKLVVEPSGAMAVAAARQAAELLGLKRVVAILCGGNADIRSGRLPWAEPG